MTRSFSLLLVLALLGAVTSCSKEPTPPAGGSSEEGPTIQLMGPGGTIEVTVLKSDGSPAGVGYTVTAVNSMIGPFLEDGAPARAGTDAFGKATLNMLAFGSYCVYVIPADVLTLLEAEQIWPPPTSPAFGAGGTEAGVVTGKGLKSVPLTRGNYLTFCVKSPVLKINNTATKKVTLKLARPGVLNFQYLNLLGQQTGVPGFGVISLEDDPPPWFDPPAPDVKPGLPFGATNSTFASQDFFCPPGQATVVESGIGAQGGQGNLTATTPINCPPAGTVQTETVFQQPLMCAVQTKPEGEFDAQPGKVNFLPFIRDGFLADENLKRLSNAVAIWYEQEGDGEAALKFRNRQDGTQNLEARYNCTTGACTKGSQSGSLTSVPGFVADVFFTPLGGTRVRVTWILRGLPTDQVEYLLSTATDQFPDPARSGEPAAFSPIKVNEPCTAGESNDDRWSISF